MRCLFALHATAVSAGVLLFCMLVAPGARAVDLNPDDVLLARHSGFGGECRKGCGAIVRPESLVLGTVTVITAAGLIANPGGFDFESDGSIIIGSVWHAISQDNIIPARIIRFNVSTGQQELLSEGGHLSDPRGIAVSDGGRIFVAENVNDGIIEIDAVTGSQTWFPVLGPASPPKDLVVFGEETIYFTDGSFDLYRMDLPSGTVTQIPIINDNGGFVVFSVGGIAKASDGGIYVANYQGPPLLHVDRVTGIFTSISTSPLLDESWDVAELASGSLVVTAHGISSGRIQVIDPVTGNIQSLLSGTTDIFRLAVYPSANPIPPPIPALSNQGLIALGVLLVGAMYFTIRHRRAFSKA